MEELVSLTRSRLARAARRIVGAHDADDCVQTAYLSLVHKRGAGLSAPVLPWLLTAVIRTAYRRHAQAQRREEIASRLRWAKEPETPVVAAERLEEITRLRAQVDRLPAGLRDVVVLYHLAGLPAADVAALLGLREAAVRKRLQRARALLRARLSPRVAGAFLFVPWLLADTAGAAALTLGGIAVPKKALVATALVLVALLVGVWTLREDAPPARDRGGTRTTTAAQPAEPPTAATPTTADDAAAPPAPASPTPTLRGRVFDLAGRPIAGATVRWLGRDGEGEATTAADGSYGLAPRDARYLLVHAPGFAPLLLKRRPHAPGQDFYLGQGARLTGRVVTADGGEPVPNARVLLWSVEGHMYFEGEDGRRVRAPWAPRALAETRSGPDGAFVFEHVPAEAFHRIATSMSGTQGPLVGYVRALAPGLVCDGAEVPARPAGETLQVTLRCWTSGSIDGRVVDRGGRGVAGLRVFGVSPERRVRRWPVGLFPEAPRPDAITDEDGRYRLDGLPAPARGEGDVRLWIRDPVLDTAGPRQEAAVRVRAGTTRAPDIVWTPPAPPEVEVTVRDADGRPVADALVRLSRFRTSGRTDADGHARVAAWVERLWTTPATVVVSAPGFATAHETTPLEPGRTVSLRVTLQPGFAVAGELVWEDDVPVADAAVAAVPAGATGGEMTPPLSAGRPSGGPTRTFWTRTGPDGRFAFTALPAGPYRLQAKVDGHAAERDGARAGETVRLVLPAPSPESVTGRVEGTVVDAETGVPLLRAAIYLERGREREVAKLVGPGRFAFERVPPAVWTLCVHAYGYLPFEQTDVDVRAGTTRDGFRIRLARGITVKGEVRNASRHALKSAMVVLASETGATFPTMLRDDGRYEVSGIRPGRYRLSVSAAGARIYVATRSPELLTIAEGARETRRDLDVIDGAELALRIENPTAILEVTDAGGRVWWRVSGTTAPRSDVVRVPPGSYTVRLRDDTRTIAEQSRTLGAGDRIEVKLDGAAPR